MLKTPQYFLALYWFLTALKMACNPKKRDVFRMGFKGDNSPERELKEKTVNSVIA